nr:coat protein [Ranunculus mosaic virus]
GKDDIVDAGKKQDQEKDKQQPKFDNPPQLPPQDKTAKPDQPSSSNVNKPDQTVKDQDVNAGTKGILSVPRLKKLGNELQLPKYQNKSAINLDFLITYEPQQEDLSNKRSTDDQFAQWFEGVRDEYGVTDEQMRILLGGLMVWCIENGTSPSINGNWIMMDGNEQVSYPIKPLLDHAKPTFRQIMTRFSPLAVAYITKVNQKRAHMPRYGSQRNLTDMSLACFAFDFYEINSRTPARAREAHMQMKAAAIRNGSNRMFGLDGNVGTQVQDTERHTTNDVNRHVHNLDGASTW